MRRIGFVILALMATPLAGCRSDTRVVAEVGRFAITWGDVELRDRVARVYYPEERRSVGLAQLIDAYTAAQVLENNGHAITPEILEAERERIERNTQAPEVLSKIQAVFGADRDAYLRVYVLPVYAKRVIYFDFYRGNESYQRESRAKAEAVAGEAARAAANAPPTDRTLTRFAGEKGLKAAPLTLSLADGIFWGEPDDPARAKRPKAKPADDSSPRLKAARDRVEAGQAEAVVAEAKGFFEKYVADLRPGEVRAAPVSYEESWLVLRYLRRIDPKTHLLEAISVPKRPYSEWYAAEAGRVAVRK